MLSKPLNMLEILEARREGVARGTGQASLLQILLLYQRPTFIERSQAARKLRENLNSPQKRRSKIPHFVAMISRCCDLGSYVWEVFPDAALVCRVWQ
jgi:hypothetical protein